MLAFRLRPLAILALVLALCGVAPAALAAQEPAPEPAPALPSSPTWALAIHGGAGVIDRDLPEEEKKAYYASLETALAAGKQVLASGGAALDAVEAVILLLEDDPKFNAGKGAVYTHEGTHELDAAVMVGADRSCGAVTGIKTVRHPIQLARLVMERSPHVFMMGEGAEALAERAGLERVENSWFDTETRREALEKAIEREKTEDDWTDSFGKFGTVGAAALDRHGHMAAATSTGGLTNKRFGRIGDVPVIGAGTYADDATCALSGTGQGEQFIRHTVARTISALVEYRGMTCSEAAREVMENRLQPGDGGVIGVGRDGSIVWELNSQGMFRGAANSNGRFEVRIWRDE